MHSTVKTEKEAEAEINTLLVGRIQYQQVGLLPASLIANRIRSDSFLMGQETSSVGAESQITWTLQTKYVYSALIIWFQGQIMSLFTIYG